MSNSIVDNIKYINIDPVERTNAQGGKYRFASIVTENGETVSTFESKLEEFEEGDNVRMIVQEVERRPGIKTKNLVKIDKLNSESTVKNSKEEIKVMKHVSRKQSVETDVTVKNEDKYFTVTGKVFYAHVKERDTKGRYPTNAYKLDLAIDDAHVKALEAKGVQVKNKGDEKGNFVTLKSKKFQPKVIGPNGEDLTGQTLIGNGSLVTITTMLYDNTESNVRAGKGGKKLLGLGTIKLKTLNEYQTKPLVDNVENETPWDNE